MFINIIVRDTYEKNIKQIIMIAALAASFTSVFAAGSPKTDTKTTWDVSEPSTKDNGAYVISSAEELAWFADKVNSGENSLSAVLAADIDLNPTNDLKRWDPIGRNDEIQFKGTFDGKGHTIKHMFFRNGTITIKNKTVTHNQFAGLFGVIDANGVVKNVNVEGDSIYQSFGGNEVLTGHIAGLNLGTIDSCTVDTSSRILVVANGDNLSKAGGIAGQNGWTNKPGLISNSTHKGLIIDLCDAYGHDRQHNVGGIVGRNENSGTTKRSTISNCENTGNVYGTTGRARTFVGGIAGVNRNGIVEGCSNSGNINATNTDANDGSDEWTYAKAAGIVGEHLEGGSILSCTNTGSISTHDYVVDDEENKLINKLIKDNHFEWVSQGKSNDKTEHMAGGIVGLFRNGTMDKCTNFGDVRIYFREAGASANYTYAYVGGIAGMVDANNSQKSYVTNVYGHSNVRVEYGDLKYHVYQYGTLIGELNTGANLTNAYYVPGDKSGIFIKNYSSESRRHGGRLVGYMKNAKATSAYYDNEIALPKLVTNWNGGETETSKAITLDIGTFESGNDTIAVRGYNTETMKSKQMAWYLNTGYMPSKKATTHANSKTWTVVTGEYPKFATDTELPIYRVQFKKNAASDDNRYTNSEGTVDVPGAPAEANEDTHIFGGWLLGEKTVKTASDMPVLTNDATLTAIWQTSSDYPFTVAFFNDAADEVPANSYLVVTGATVSVDDEGNTTINGEIDGEKGKSVSIEIPSKESTAEFEYTFDRWVQQYADYATEGEFSFNWTEDFPKYYGGTAAINNAGTVTHDVAYVASYNETKRKYAVTFKDAEGKTIIVQDEEGNEITDAEYGSKAVKPSQNPTKKGYRFVSWYDEANDQHDNFAIFGDKTYTPNFVKTWTITYSVDGALKPFTVDEGLAILEDFSKEGYSLTFVNKDGETVGKPGDDISVEDDLILSAKYVANTYTLTYKVNDIQVGSVESHTYSSDVILNDVNTHNQTPNMNDISAWACVDESENKISLKSVEDDEGKQIQFKMPASNVVCAATISMKVFKVVVSVNDTKMGSVTGLNENGEYHYGDAITLAAVAATGYVFTNWSDDYKSAERTLVANKDYTLTANFEAVSSSSEAKEESSSSVKAEDKSSSSAKAEDKSSSSAKAEDKSSSSTKAEDKSSSSAKAEDKSSSSAKAEDKSSSSAKEEDKSSDSKSDDKSSSSKKDDKDAIIASAKVPMFSLSVAGRNVQIAGARIGSTYAILDMQGRVMTTGSVDAANFSVALPRSGSYMVRVGSQTQRVNVK